MTRYLTLSILALTFEPLSDVKWFSTDPQFSRRTNDESIDVRLSIEFMQRERGRTD